MNPRPAWHPDAASLQAYVDDDASLSLAASVEAHVLSCRPCRVALAPAVTPHRLTVLRESLEDRLDLADRSWEERLLRRLGVAEVDARVVLAAPTMRRAWWLAVTLALAFAVLASRRDPAGDDVVLLLAPLLPVVATGAAYLPRLDPALSLTAATPYPAMRLLLLRSGAVASASTVLAVLACALLPIGLSQALVWLLPAVALTAAVLALSSWVDGGVAAAACSAGWLVAVWSAGRGGLDPLAVYDVGGQLASAALLCAAVVVLFRHRHRLDPGSPA
jgi:hypothetical protein